MGEANCSLHKLIADVTVFAGTSVAMVRYASGYDGQTGWFLPDDELRHLEHPDDAARRIVAGQLGLHDTPPRLDHIESFQGNDRSWHLAFHYVAQIDAPCELTSPNDVTAVAWISLDALPDRTDVAHHGWALDVLQTIRDNQHVTGK